ncbi:ATP-grasp fold amidoligase family protein [Flavobacterium proteolyticum]|uniref:Glycosyltransferase n=1 Tax=Flavobacterium proteolyticum TaxID=2911683 RepID=A0ABR9WQM8_9FLAO|nr:ATP-grasp fold amidoligase family protein [Flavobacterium proteolyticum]MBE9576228.1 glycosyltransferase [Flavobacterium proteolyticum]
MRNYKKIILRLLKNFKFLPPKIYIPLQYEYVTGNKLNLKNPKTFNEKIQWYKLNYKNPILRKLVDKYNVREFVSDKIGEKYLNTLLGVYETPNEIDFEKLPNKFVLKCVHGSGYNICVKDKSSLDIVKTKKILEKWQKKNFYNKGKEWAYKGIKPLIIAEKFLEEFEKEVINDYKFFCFDGKIKFIQIDIERQIKNYRCYYNTDWEKLNFCTEKKLFYEDETTRPEKLTEMIEVVEKLAENFPFVRVDFYLIENHIIFGELTFYPGNGLIKFLPEEMNTIVGDYFKLPN